MTEDLFVRAIPLRYEEERERLQTFLADQGLRFEADIESESKIELEKRVEVDITNDEFMESELEYMRRMIEEK